MKKINSVFDERYVNIRIKLWLLFKPVSYKNLKHKLFRVQCFFLEKLFQVSKLNNNINIEFKNKSPSGNIEK